MYSIIKLHALQFGVHSEQWVDDSGVTFLWSDSRVTILFMRFEPRVVPPAMYDEAPSYITI